MIVMENSLHALSADILRLNNIEFETIISIDFSNVTGSISFTNNKFVKAHNDKIISDYRRKLYTASRIGRFLMGKPDPNEKYGCVNYKHDDNFLSDELFFKFNMIDVVNVFALKIYK